MNSVVGRLVSNLHKEEPETFERNLGRSVPQKFKRAASNGANCSLLLSSTEDLSYAPLCIKTTVFLQIEGRLQSIKLTH